MNNQEHIEWLNSKKILSEEEKHELTRRLFFGTVDKNIFEDIDCERVTAYSIKFAFCEDYWEVNEQKPPTIENITLFKTKNDNYFYLAALGYSSISLNRNQTFLKYEDAYSAVINLCTNKISYYKNLVNIYSAEINKLIINKGSN